MASPGEDWMRALHGQLPQYQALPQDPNMDPVANFGRMLISGGLNIPPSMLAALNSLRPSTWVGHGAQPEAAPVAAAPMGPPALFNPTAPAGPLRSPATAPVGGGAAPVLSFPTPQLVPPPELPMPPQMTAGPGVNLDPVRAMLDQAKPVAPDQGLLNDSKFAGILSGLARGAGSVDATTPGAFGKALAMWGAGGAEGMRAGVDKKFDAGQQHNRETSQYYQNRAGSELQMQKLVADQAQNQALVQFENAKANYQTTVANQKAQYEFQLQKAGLEAPKVTQNAQGILIQQMNPKTGQTDVQFIDVTPTMQKLEQTDRLIKASQMPGGEGLKLKMIEAEGHNPTVKDQIYRREAVREIFAANAGGAVFGPAYTQAVDVAKKEIERENPAILADAKLYTAALNEKVMARILPLISQRNDWIKVAAPHSYTASIMSNSMAPPPSSMVAPPTLGPR